MMQWNDWMDASCGTGTKPEVVSENTTQAPFAQTLPSVLSFRFESDDGAVEVIFDEPTNLTVQVAPRYPGHETDEAILQEVASKPDEPQGMY
jgi:hypothetical protein